MRVKTTLQVHQTTKQILEDLKKKENLSTYDQVIRHLVKKHIHIPKSMFGAMKGLRPWKKETDRMDFDHEF